MSISSSPYLEILNVLSMLPYGSGSKLTSITLLEFNDLFQSLSDQPHPHISGIIHIFGDNSDNNSSYERKLRSGEPINMALLLVSNPTSWRSVRETDLQSCEMTCTAIFNSAPLRQKEGFQSRVCGGLSTQAKTPLCEERRKLCRHC